MIYHGIPDDRPLREGNVVNIGITCYLDGYHGDCSEMFTVGGEDAIDRVGRRLLQSAYDCWIRALDFVKPRRDYKDIGAVIEGNVTAGGFTTVRSFCGHGIGRAFHAKPNVLHYRTRGSRRSFSLPARAKLPRSGSPASSAVTSCCAQG